jgi:hypothetical protein
MGQALMIFSEKKITKIRPDFRNLTKIYNKSKISTKGHKKYAKKMG